MNHKLYSFYKNRLCYITPDNKLFISSVENIVFVGTQINVDVDIIASTIGVTFISNFIILHTNTDDVYVYNILYDTIKYLGNYFISTITCQGTEITLFIVFITNREIITFDTNFRRTSEYILPTDEVPEKIYSFESNEKYFVCTSEKTYILNMDLVVVACIDAKYISIAKYYNFYYCVTPKIKNFFDFGD